MQTVIAKAIESKKLIAFMYGDHLREVEPHVLGIINGNLQLLSYQVGGSSSSGGIPEWRRFELMKITSLRVLEKDFKGARPVPSGKHSSWDQQIAVVAP